MALGPNLPTFGQGSGILGSIFSRLFHEGGLVGASGVGLTQIAKGLARAVRSGMRGL